MNRFPVLQVFCKFRCIDIVRRGVPSTKTDCGAVVGLKAELCVCLLFRDSMKSMEKP